MESPSEKIMLVTDFANLITLKNPHLDIVPDSEDFPWFIRQFQRILKMQHKQGTLLLPNLRDYNDTIAVFSDYGGESANSRFSAYSFLACAYNQRDPFDHAMRRVREAHGLNDPYKEIAFKDMRYGPLQRALPDYLRNLNNLTNGLLLTVIVAKDVGSLFGENKREAQRWVVNGLKEGGFGDWKPHVAEKLVITVHFVAYLVALLSRPQSKVFWMTDHDAIAQSREKHGITLKLFNQHLNHYCQHPISLVGGAVPFEERNTVHDDLLSAPDLIAGAIEHYMTRSAVAEAEPMVKTYADDILQWLALSGIALKKQTMMIRRENGQVAAGQLNFVLKESNPSSR